MTADAVLARLAAATAAARTMASGPADLGAGVGTVAAAWEGGALVLTEAGTWTPPGARPIRWRAVARWRAEGAALAVVQERRGVPAAAVLDRQPDGTWVGREPHVCGADRYAVSLRLGAEAVEVTWTIAGPRKAALVGTRYRRGA